MSSVTSCVGESNRTRKNLSPNSGSDNKRPRKQRKSDKSKDRMARKRQLDNSSIVEIATSCEPAKYPTYDTLPDTVSSLYLSYLQSLQLNDCIARPTNWSEIINNASYQKSPKEAGIKQPTLHHPWNNLRSVHYTPIVTSIRFQAQLNNGLPLPIFIPPGSQLGQEIASQTPWPSQPLAALLDLILKPDSALIETQDHSLPSIDMFTVTSTCKDVRARFNLDPNHRGPAWNCLEIKDTLVGFKGPRPLEDGGSLRRWQSKDISGIDKNRTEFLALPGAKQVDEWLLVSEKNSGSFAHVDVGFGTWISCLAGKKTLWLRNPSVRDRRIWTEFDVSDDHRAFQEPWGRIDLYPGSVLVFPPGTIHTVFTENDSVFCGGHFLIPQVMDRFLDTLGQTEMDPTRTNDFKGGDFFHILENFILEALSPWAAGLKKGQLHEFVLTLKEYSSLQPKARASNVPESQHLKRRRDFLSKVKKEKWVETLEEKVTSLHW